MRIQNLRYKLLLVAVMIAVLALVGLALAYGSRETSALSGTITVVLLLVCVLLYFARKLGCNTLFR
jgi:hypothetical protein